MHNTLVKFKDGCVVCAPIRLFRPAEGWFTLHGYSGLIYFKDIESAITEGERSPGQADELYRARIYMQFAREYGWDNVPKDYPKQEWE